MTLVDGSPDPLLLSCGVSGGGVVAHTERVWFRDAAELDREGIIMLGIVRLADQESSQLRPVLAPLVMVPDQ